MNRGSQGEGKGVSKAEKREEGSSQIVSEEKNFRST